MFSSIVAERLGYYVYFLEDPRTEEVFYIGKGTGNRIFQHLDCAIGSRERNAKLDRVREIHRSGHEVRHYIVRHGLTESTAFEVEAALIDFVGLGNLSNRQGGHLSADFGMLTPREVVAIYDAEELETDLPVLLINIGRKVQGDMNPRELYNATRKSWALASRRERVQFVVSVYGGLTREAYRVKKWTPVWGSGRSRWKFKGKVARSRIRDELCHKSVKSHFRPGVANPVKYINC